MRNFLMIKDLARILLNVVIVTFVMFFAGIFLCEKMAKFVTSDSIILPLGIFFTFYYKYVVNSIFNI